MDAGTGILPSVRNATGGVFHAEIGWADSQTTTINANPVHEVYIAGVKLDTTNKYYYNGTNGAAGEASSQDTREGKSPNASFDADTGTVTLNGFVYEGSKNGIEAAGDLHIVLQGRENRIKVTGDLHQNGYGIWALKNLSISGERTNGERAAISVSSDRKNAIYAFDDNPPMPYQESIRIENVEITATAHDVGIVAPQDVIIEDSIIDSTGGNYGIQGGYFGNTTKGSTSIKNSTVIARATGDETGGSAFKVRPTVSNGAGSITASTDTNGTNAEIVTDFGNANISKYKYIKLSTEHSHCICGKATHVDIGDHKTDTQTKFATALKQDADGSLMMGGIEWKTTRPEITTSAGMTYTYPYDVYVLETGNYYLEGDLKLNLSYAMIFINGEVQLCLNGHSITMQNGSNAIDILNGKMLTLTDCNGSGQNNGKINHEGKDSIGRGVIATGTFNLYGGNITGNSTFGGETGEDANRGGGVYVGSVGTLNMYGGAITKNIANTHKKTDGTVSAGNGGGVYCDGAFNLYGGSISENVAYGVGGGVVLGTNASFKVSGDVNITGNHKTGSADQNVYLYDNQYIVVNTGGLGDSAKIGVTTETKPEESSKVTIAKAEDGTNLNISGYANSFTSDDMQYESVYDAATSAIVLKVNPTPKRAVSIPAADTTTFTYNGKDQTYNIPDSAYYSVAGNIHKNAGLYAVTVHLKDTAQTAWTDGTIEDKTYNFDIKKAKVTIQADNKIAYVGDTSLPSNSYSVVSGLAKGESLAGTATYTYYENFGEAAKPILAENIDLNKAEEYDISVSGLTVPDQSNYERDIVCQWGTLSIKQKTSGGSSGGGYVAPSTDVKTSGSADSKVTSSPSTVQNETRTDASGKQETVAKVTVSAANQREILSQAKANKSKRIIIQIAKTAVQGDAKLELNLDKPFVQSILHDTEASLTIRTADGDKVIAREALKTLLAQTEGNTVVIDPAAQENPTDPAEPSKAETLAALDSSRLVARSKLVTLKNGRKGIRITWSDKNGAEMNFDGMEIYRSTKKNRFGKKPFYATKGGKSAGYYINSKSLKSGVTYYYKVRGYVLIDGQKHYTDLSLKAIRTVK